MSIFIYKILIDLCDDVDVPPLVTASTNKRDMTTIKTIAMASPTCEVSMYFVTLKKIYS